MESSGQSTEGSGQSTEGSGQSTEGSGQRVRIGILDRALDPAAALAEVGHPSAGAVVLFVGTVRDHSGGEPELREDPSALLGSGRDGHSHSPHSVGGEPRERRQGVTHLEYEAFEERVVESIGRIVAEALDRWPVLAGVVEHRVGRVEVGEPSVVVAVATAHRVEAFEAARYLIDELKARAPLWKKEHWPGGAEWVEGA